MILYCIMIICSRRQEGLLAIPLYWNNVKKWYPTSFLACQIPHNYTHVFWRQCNYLVLGSSHSILYTMLGSMPTNRYMVFLSFLLLTRYMWCRTAVDPNDLASWVKIKMSTSKCPKKDNITSKIMMLMMIFWSVTFKKKRLSENFRSKSKKE